MVLANELWQDKKLILEIVKHGFVDLSQWSQIYLMKFEKNSLNAQKRTERAFKIEEDGVEKYNINACLIKRISSK